MSDRNERILNIIKDNLGGYKNEANILFKLDKSIQQKLKIISGKLIPFMIQNCKEEYNKLITKFKIVESSEYGSQIIPINKDEKDMNLLNSVERCIDRYTGINKAITMYEVDTRNTIYEDDRCKRACIADSEKLNDNELTECLSNCYGNFYKDSIRLAEDFEADLNKINLKL